MGAKEFVYYWEWIYLQPGRSSHINEEMIDYRYSLPGKYGLEDLEALCALGYIDKISEHQKGEPFREKRVVYKLR